MMNLRYSVSDLISNAFENFTRFNWPLGFQIILGNYYTRFIDKRDIVLIISDIKHISMGMLLTDALFAILYNKFKYKHSTIFIIRDYSKNILINDINGKLTIEFVEKNTVAEKYIIMGVLI